MKRETAKNIKIAFFDIDGTLIDMEKKKITPVMLKTLKELRERGILLCLATGRPPRMIPTFEGFSFDAYLAFNAAYCYTKDRVIFSNPIPTADVQAIIRNAERLHRPISLSTLTADGANGTDEDLRDYFAFAKQSVHVTEDFLALSKEAVYQIMVGGGDAVYADILQGVDGARATAWWTRAADIIPAKGGKGLGVDQVLAYYGLAREQALAFGDGTNDIEMLRTVGTGVAMGNATDDVKAVADECCGKVSEEGIYQYCKENGLISGGCKMNIKLIALDMDGTLLDSEKNLPEDFIPWVKAHPEVKTVIASGRQYYTLEKDFIPIRDELTFIAENGGLVFEQGEVIYKDEMRTEDVLRCLDIIDAVPNAVPIVCGARSAYLTEPDEEIDYNATMYYKRRQIVEDLREAVKDDAVVKIAVYVRDEGAEEAMRYFENLEEPLMAVLSGPCWIDLANITEGKGNAVRAIQEKYGISPDECMSFGDYLNDVTLLQSCTESYCMKNGHEDLKAIAKHVTERTNDEDGVMDVIRKL